MKRSKWISLKIISDRARAHLATINFLMISYLVIMESPYPLWFVLPVAGVAVLVIGYLDYRFIFPRELNQVSAKNPYWQAVLKELKEINLKLKKEVM